MEAVPELADGIRGLLEVDRHHHQPLTAIGVIGRADHRQLVPAGRAPGGPEVDQHRTAAEAGQRDLVPINVGQGEVRRHRTGPHGAPSARDPWLVLGGRCLEGVRERRCHREVGQVAIQDGQLIGEDEPAHGDHHHGGDRVDDACHCIGFPNQPRELPDQPGGHEQR